MILLAIWTVLFVSFSSATSYVLPTSSWIWNSYNSSRDYYDYPKISLYAWDSYTISSEYDFSCVERASANNGAQYHTDKMTSWQNLPNYQIVCFTWWQTVYIRQNEVLVYLFKLWENWVPDWNLMSSMQCQTEYNLIPINEVDSSYCESNNLCPAWWTPSDCPNVWVSNLFINDIFHPWAFNVIMNIPSEIDRDYAYTNSWNNINIDVVWYNQDEEYINAWIDTNNYKPTSSDFTNIFSNFSQFWGLLIATLFVILVFYFIKKMF